MLFLFIIILSVLNCNYIFADTLYCLQPFEYLTSPVPIICDYDEIIIQLYFKTTNGSISFYVYDKNDNICNNPNISTVNYYESSYINTDSFNGKITIPISNEKICYTFYNPNLFSTGLYININNTCAPSVTRLIILIVIAATIVIMAYVIHCIISTKIKRLKEQKRREKLVLIYTLTPSYQYQSYQQSDQFLNVDLQD
jgi:hypothetical protein